MKKKNNQLWFQAPEMQFDDRSNEMNKFMNKMVPFRFGFEMKMPSMDIRKNISMKRKTILKEMCLYQLI